MLKIQDLHTYYGAGHILHGVSLAIEPGTIAAVLGRNGVGKTTMVRSIMGLAPPQRGRILVGDADIAGWPPHHVARHGVAYVPEGRMILGDLTVIENIKVAQRTAAQIWTIPRLLELFPELASRRTHKGSQLSGGEQQMLALARALVTDPSVMLLDEPSQGLAPLVVKELSNVIRSLKEASVTILLVEQNLKLAEAVADQIHVMVKGQIVFEAPLDAFLREKEDVKARYLTL